MYAARSYVPMSKPARMFGARFLLEPREAFRIRRKGSRQHFHGDLTLPPRIACPIHLTHAAAERCDDFARSLSVNVSCLERPI